jgi:hypothetical protein
VDVLVTIITFGAIDKKFAHNAQLKDAQKDHMEEAMDGNQIKKNVSLINFTIERVKSALAVHQSRIQTEHQEDMDVNATKTINGTL